MLEGFAIFPLGDGAITISFGTAIDEAVNQKVLQLFHRLKSHSSFFIDVVPAYSSLTVYYDVLSLRQENKTAYETAKELLLSIVEREEDSVADFGRQIRIPVCYAKKFAPDLEELAEGKGLPVEEVVRLHTSKTYRVYMIGFLPGFPYMAKVDERIATGRKSSPRTAIAAGSVGIAGAQTGIYPFNSPGGWNIIGQTPLQLFHKERKSPVLLQPGDCVTFYSITEDEFENYQSRIA